MAYIVQENDGYATIVDAETRKSIVSIVTTEDSFYGTPRNYQTPVFEPGMAHRIVNALNLADAVNGVVVTKPGIYL